MTPRPVQVGLIELAANPTVRPLYEKRRMETCSVCGARTRYLLTHCREVGDDPHRVLEVMAS